jgi:hypothetical protein
VVNDLIEFLHARCTEAETDAVNIHYASPDVRECSYVTAVGHDNCTCGVPTRLLAEVDAKRRIIDLIVLNADSQPLYRDSGAEVWEDALRLLALPFAGHPHFREEWRR